MTNGAPEPLHTMTPEEFEEFRKTAQRLRKNYERRRDRWFRSLGRDYNPNPKPGRPR